MVRVIVCGGRNYANSDQIHEVLSKLDITELAHGGASGADELAGSWAWFYDIPACVFPADWLTYGKAAGPIRNQRMLNEFKPDQVIAFPGGRGTAHMVRIAEAAGVPVLKVDA